MRHLLGLILAAVALASCSGKGGDTAVPAQSAANSAALLSTVAVASVTVAGTIPATTGVPTVLVNGTAATITGDQWSCAVTAAGNTVTVNFLSDGEIIATKEIAVTAR